MEHTQPIKILLISHDSAQGTWFAEQLISSQDHRFDWHYLRLSEEISHHLSKHNVNVISLDAGGLSSEQVLGFLEKAGRQASDIPVLILADQEDDALACAAAEKGAQEWLIKNKLTGPDFVRSVFFALKRKKFEGKERQELTNFGKQAELATQAKTEFLAKVSHEMRTPLNAILGFSSLLQKSRLNAKQHEQLETVISCGGLLLGICDDMLDISKIEAGQITLEIAPFDLSKLIEEVFKIVRIRLGDKPLKFYFEIETDVPTDLQGDAKRLKQILINLLNNAVKFTDQGEVSLHVSRVKNKMKTAQQHMLRFAVKDSGIGIPKEKQEDIFGLFVQADYSRVHQEGGAGLGLAISRAFVQAMGGKISIESEPGKGSEFIFTAIFQEKELSPAVDMPQRKPGQEAITQRNIAEKLDCKGIKVLVAEDGIPSQELMKAYFDYLGCSADYVSDGQQAVDQLSRQHYDLCLMDMGMPVLDGVEATKIIRKKISKDLPIIALTAAAMKRDQEKCLAAGMNDYIKKPVDVIKLKEKILMHTKYKANPSS